MAGTDAAPQPRHPLVQYASVHYPSAHYPTAHQPSAHYPSAQRLDLTEQLHGRTVADPYRWLEDPVDPRTITWATEQDSLTRNVLGGLPGRMALAGELQRLLATGWVAMAAWRNGRAFFTRREPDGEHAVLYVREPGTDGATTDRVLLDVMTLDPSGLTTLDLWSPSLEGDRLAYQISIGGDEESTLHVIDVSTGKLLGGPVQRCRYSPIGWLPGGAEFYYVRRLPPEQVPDGEEQFHRRVWRHRVGADPATDLLVHGEGQDPTNYYGVQVSADGRWLLVHASPGTARRDSVWIADLHGSGELQAVLTDADAVRCTAWVARDGKLYLLTTMDAPRWRLCVADPSDPGPAGWTELIAADPAAVLNGIRWLEDPDGGEPLLVAARTRHAITELSLHAVDDGTLRGTIPLPGVGSLTGVSTVDELTPAGAGQVWIGWTDFRTPPCVHRYELRSGSTELVESAPGAAVPADVHTQQVTFCSDNDPQNDTAAVTVRMFIVSPAVPTAPRPDRPRPTLLTGYGGFALSRAPAYTASALAWVSAGGVWAQASLRGGGEEGEDWHRAGMREHKRNYFDDFHAAAQALVDGGWTTALQHATTADPARAPVLIRREVEVGHAARAVSRTVALTTDQLCFLAQYTGLDLEAVHTG